jgi:hypothetical protein
VCTEYIVHKLQLLKERRTTRLTNVKTTTVSIRNVCIYLNGINSADLMQPHALRDLHIAAVLTAGPNCGHNTIPPNSWCLTPAPGFMVAQLDARDAYLYCIHNRYMRHHSDERKKTCSCSRFNERSCIMSRTSQLKPHMRV